MKSDERIVMGIVIVGLVITIAFAIWVIALPDLPWWVKLLMLN